MTGKYDPQSAKESRVIKTEDTMKVKIKRQPNDWRVGEVPYSKLQNLQWDILSGGVKASTNQYYIFAYVWCDQIEGVIAHSCKHGDGPHLIKVCITKKNNDPDVFARIKSVLEEKPKYFKVRK